MNRLYYDDLKKRSLCTVLSTTGWHWGILRRIYGYDGIEEPTLNIFEIENWIYVDFV